MQLLFVWKDPDSSQAKAPDFGSTTGNLNLKKKWRSSTSRSFLSDLTWSCSKVIRLKGWRQRRFDFFRQALKLTNVQVSWDRFFGFGVADCEYVLISCHGKMDGWFIYSTSLPSSALWYLCRYCFSCTVSVNLIERTAKKEWCKNTWVVNEFLCLVCFVFMTINLIKKWHFQ